VVYAVVVSYLNTPGTVGTAVKPELPANFEEATWCKLRDCVTAVHCKRPVSCSLEELYTVRHAPYQRSLCSISPQLPRGYAPQAKLSVHGQQDA
jgi:hypothetical protein